MKIKIEEKKKEFRCSGCEKEISIGEAYPAYNHPEAPPVCFDCLPGKVKEEIQKRQEKNEHT